MDFLVMEIFADLIEQTGMVNDAKVLQFAEEMHALKDNVLKREQFLVSQTLNVLDLESFATRLLEQFVELALKVFVELKSKWQCVKENLFKQSLQLRHHMLDVTNKLLNTCAQPFARSVLTRESLLLILHTHTTVKL
jgi:hypothetical protein